MPVKTIAVKVTPNARKAGVTLEGSVLKVKVTAPAVDGKANSALIEVLAKYFNVRKSAIAIIRGETSRTKVVQVQTET
jgi:uncharacterized protein (TIGR00251 family)